MPNKVPSPVPQSVRMTDLNPLEEVLFKSWATAHGIEDHDKPENPFDYRGLYKSTRGQMHPPDLNFTLMERIKPILQNSDQAGVAGD